MCYFATIQYSQIAAQLYNIAELTRENVSVLAHAVRVIHIQPPSLFLLIHLVQFSSELLKNVP